MAYKKIPINKLYLALSRYGRNYYNLDTKTNIERMKRILELLDSHLSSENFTYHVPMTIKMSTEDISLIFGANIPL